MEFCIQAYHYDNSLNLELERRRLSRFTDKMTLVHARILLSIKKFSFSYSSSSQNLKASNSNYRMITSSSEIQGQSVESGENARRKFQSWGSSASDSQERQPLIIYFGYFVKQVGVFDCDFIKMHSRQAVEVKEKGVKRGTL